MATQLPARPVRVFPRNTAPNNNTDATQGYRAGDQIIDTVGGGIYECESATNGAAVWTAITSAGAAPDISALSIVTPPVSDDYTDYLDVSTGLTRRCTITDLMTLAPAGGGSGTMNVVKAAGTPVGDADIVTLDFASPFSVTETPNTEINVGLNTAAVLLAAPTDASWADGLFPWVSGTTKLVDALDDLNEILTYLAPAQPLSLAAAVLAMTGTVMYAGLASAGTGQYFKSAAGEDCNAYTGGKVTLLDTITLTVPTIGAAESGGDDAFANGAEGVLSSWITASGAEAERGIINLATATPPDTDGSLTLTAQNAGYNSFPPWVRGHAYILTTAYLGQGYNKIIMRHALGGNRDTTAYELFYDNSFTALTFTVAAALAVNTALYLYRSGVKFYTTNSIFYLSFTATNAFKNTYQSNAFGQSGFTGISAVTIGLTHAGWNGTVSNPPNLSETAVLSGGASIYALQVLLTGVRSINNRMTVTGRKPGRFDVTSQTQGIGGSGNLLLDTYANTSTALYEYFDDENYRHPHFVTQGNNGSGINQHNTIPGADTGNWTSATALANGEAQFYNGAAYYPTINFSSGYHPSASQPNYSAFSGNQIFDRWIKAAGGPHSSGQLELEGLVNADVGQLGSGAINVEIKLPTQTGWLDLGKSYNLGTFTGIDGDGCRTAQSSAFWSWTSGTFTTANSGYGIMVRVTFRNATKSITRMREMTW